MVGSREMHLTTCLMSDNMNLKESMRSNLLCFSGPAAMVRPSSWTVRPARSEGETNTVRTSSRALWISNRPKDLYILTENTPPQCHIKSFPSASTHSQSCSHQVRLLLQPSASINKHLKVKDTKNTYHAKVLSGVSAKMKPSSYLKQVFDVGGYKNLTKEKRTNQMKEEKRTDGPLSLSHGGTRLKNSLDCLGSVWLTHSNWSLDSLQRSAGAATNLH